MTDMKALKYKYQEAELRPDSEFARDGATRRHRFGRPQCQLFASAKHQSMKWMLVAALSMAFALPAFAQGPKAAPALLLFSYQVNGALPLAPQTVQITVPTALANSVLTVAVSSSAGWLTVTPDTGRAPLALSVRANPTSLSPGSYTGQITVTSALAASNPAVIGVTLSITNPPSTLSISAPPAPYYSSPPPALTFTYLTGDIALGGGPYPSAATLNVASTGGDSIQFNVTAAMAAGGATSGGTTGALRVAASGQTPALTTAGFAIPGNFAPINVSLDPVTLDTLLPGTYSGTVTFAASKAANGSASVAVSLQVSAGAPIVNSIWPASVNAAPVVAPVIDIAGDNFFSTSVVTIMQDGSRTPVTVPYTLISRKHLQATIPVAAITPTATVTPLGGWSVVVTNPGQSPVATALIVTDGTVPSIANVVDSASYLSSAFQSGTTPDPVLGLQTVAPREIISLFGHNLGPSSITMAVPAVAPGTTAPMEYPTELANVQVQFQIPAGAGTYISAFAPLIMVSGNQINAVVPAEVSQAVGVNGPPSVTITVLNASGSTSPAKVFVVAANPAIFTFAGLGQGQAAVLNYDIATSSYSINSTKNAAARGSTISIYTTGMGDLGPPAAPLAPCTSPPAGIPLGDGDVACGAIALPNFAQNVNVTIDGQLSVVTYAGTSPGSVGGLIQINAVVPPTAHTGAAIPLLIAVGDKTNARRSQPLVTMSVK